MYDFSEDDDVNVGQIVDDPWEKDLDDLDEFDWWDDDGEFFDYNPDLG